MACKRHVQGPEEEPIVQCAVLLLRMASGRSQGFVTWPYLSAASLHESNKIRSNETSRILPVSISNRVPVHSYFNTFVPLIVPPWSQVFIVRPREQKKEVIQAAQSQYVRRGSPAQVTGWGPDEIHLYMRWQFSQLKKGKVKKNKLGGWGWLLPKKLSPVNQRPYRMKWFSSTNQRWATKKKEGSVRVW